MRAGVLAMSASAIMVLTMATVLGMAPQSLAADPSPAGAATPAVPDNALPPNPAIDAKVKAYLQKRFMVTDQKHIELGPVIPTAWSGVYVRTLRISNDKGQSASGIIYTNATEDQMIVGQSQFYDVTKDPWEKVDLKNVHLDDRAILGNPAAPVTIIEFADFECPFCARAFANLETMVNTTYKDKVRVIYKNYPLNSHPWAIRAAIGAECARLQNPDTFWEFARDYYTNQGRSPSRISTTTFI